VTDSSPARPGLRKLARKKAELVIQSRGRQEYVRAPQRNWYVKNRPQTLVQAPVLAQGQVPPAAARIAWPAGRLALSVPRRHRKQTISAERLPVPGKRAALPAVCAHSAPESPGWRIAPADARDQPRYSGTNP